MILILLKLGRKSYGGRHVQGLGFNILGVGLVGHAFQ